MQSVIVELLKHYEELRRYLVWELRDPHHAADIAQTTFERVYTHAMDGRQKGAPVESPKALLFRVARNLCIDESRHRRVVQEWAADRSHAAGQAGPSSEYLAAHRQLLDRVIEIIETIPPRRREVFLLFRAYGYSHAEIAERLGITEMAVAKHLLRSVMDCSRALAELREHLMEPAPFHAAPSFHAALAEDHG